MAGLAVPGVSAWPPEVQRITYRSAADGTDQPAMWWAPPRGSGEPRPLLVALHTWSADYTQPDSAPYARWCIQKQWAFIHPDFRGPNWTPQACGSDLAVQDVLSAVDYARSQATVDPRRIYLAGASGGGHMALLMAGRAPGLWAGVSAWVPITDLTAWYEESRARGAVYADHIVRACGGIPTQDPEAQAQARHRSPLTWLSRAREVPLDINAGIQDGHTGSVPISHALRAFNAVAAEKDRLTEAQIAYFTQQAAVPADLEKPADDPLYRPRRVLFRRTSGRARVTIFDGGHQILFPAALAWLAAQGPKD